MSLENNDFELVEGDDSHSPPLSESAIDDERRMDSDTSHPASDSELNTGKVHDLEHEQIARQLKGPSSDALEADCAKEQTGGGDAHSQSSSCSLEFEKESEIIDSEELERDDDNSLIEQGWTDLLDSKQIYRKVVKEGSGARPKNNQQVTIRVKGRLSDGTEVDSDDSCSFLLGHADVIQAWELCVQMMKVGEVNKLKTNARFAYGDCGRAPDIPPNSSITYEIELLDIEDGPDVMAMPANERIAFAERKKDRGNYYFNRGEFSLAIDVYQRALTMLDPMNSDEDMSAAEISEMETASTVVLCNIAAAHLKLGAAQQALDVSRKCLDIDANNVKAYFRQGKAQAMLGNYQESIKSLSRSLQLDPEAKVTKRELERVRALSEQHKQKERALYGRMLSEMRTAQPEPKWRQLVRLVRNNLWAVAAALSVVVAVWLYNYFM